MKKRIIGMLLALCLILAQLPATAFATQEEPSITSISITVDGVTYTEGNVIIKPDSTVVYTVTGTDLDQPMSCSFGHTEGVMSIISAGSGWTVNAANTTLTRDFSDRIHQFYRCDNFRVYYTTDSGERVDTDIYLTFDGGPEPAQITDLDLIVDGVTYTSGNVQIKPDSEVFLIIHGTKLYNVDSQYVIDTPLTYIIVETLSINSEHTITYQVNAEWFDGAPDYLLTYTQDYWETTIESDITVTYEIRTEELPEITGLAINVDGLTYHSGHVIVRPNSTVSFTVYGENLQNVNQMQVIDTPMAYLPLHHIPLQEDGTYLYVTYPSVFMGHTNYNITYTNDQWETTVPTDIYVTYQENEDVRSGDWTLTEDTAVALSLSGDLYIDLNGFDLYGIIALNGYKIYGIDSATNEYTCETMGSFRCLDESGNKIVPEKLHTTQDGKRYMTIETENGYTFHRFYLEITHLSLNTKSISFGYMAAFDGDEMVQAQTQSIGYKLWLPDSDGVTHTSAFQNTLTLRLINFDVRNHGETLVNACVSMTLLDGTVLESATVSYSLRQMVEMLNASVRNFDKVSLQNAAQMILSHPPMETWEVANILAAAAENS